MLIQLATVLQRMALGDSPAQGFTFLVTVMACHLGLARLSASSKTIRRILHGEPRRDGSSIRSRSRRSRAKTNSPFEYGVHRGSAAAHA